MYGCGKGTCVVGGATGIFRICCVLPVTAQMTHFPSEGYQWLLSLEHCINRDSTSFSVSAHSSALRRTGVVNAFLNSVCMTAGNASNGGAARGRRRGVRFGQAVARE